MCIFILTLDGVLPIIQYLWHSFSRISITLISFVFICFHFSYKFVFSKSSLSHFHWNVCSHYWKITNFYKALWLKFCQILFKLVVTFRSSGRILKSFYKNFGFAVLAGSSAEWYSISRVLFGHQNLVTKVAAQRLSQPPFNYFVISHCVFPFLSSLP